MESRVVKDEFQNRFGISSEKAIKYIKDFFAVNLTNFKLTDEYDEGMYYGTTYEYEKNILKINSGRGYLELDINLKGKEHYLFDYYKINVDYIIVNENNLDIIFKLLKDFLKAQKIID
jgi:hypothetical protein